MVEVSKHLFDSTCRDVPCNVLLHPWDKHCIPSYVTTYANSLMGSAKFYFVIHMAQNLMKGRKMLKREELMKAAEYYARSTLLGVLVSGTCGTFGCSVRRLLGNKLTYYTYILIPNMINGIFILLEPPSRRGLVINLFANLLIEYWMKALERKGYISMTSAKQTFLFMIGSALLFYLMRLEGDRDARTPMLWLFTPEKVRRKTDESNNVCPHEGPCRPFILKGFLKYFGFGFGFTMLRVLGPRLTTPLKALSKLRWKHLNMGLFFASYIGIYRAVICYLCRKHGYDSAMYALPAGCLAGLSFYFKPSLGFAIASLTGAFKLYSTILYEKKVIPENIPIPLLLYCFSQGVLFHARFMHQQDCPAYVMKLTNSVTNGMDKIIHARLMEVVKGVL
ncbi:transmembrane protein 135-like [Maniola jurtina]|uniref:transmembrane protein 135-like n=1 Tax=Maniola jurtina TaxID=191418 RepID=UPI001E68F7C8|nr:transmembrane protein 135-like [Maniola jurtina]XP_045767825.1 transmembrane protein 135-like [Maniola jurtina]XP_045767826.1 transmembrane protein 135-like [Maniola jurtina]